MSSAEMQQRLVKRILRVNHAGEHGAIAIYTAQIACMGNRDPHLMSWLQETLSHEIRHREAFRASMPSRRAKPCRAMFVWAVGGKLLGHGCALFGRFGVMVCTAAVERVVHEHLSEQTAYVLKHDRDLACIIHDIIREEDEHLAYADANHNPRSIFARLLSGLVAALTEILIFISTRGDSLNLKAALKELA